MTKFEGVIANMSGIDSNEFMKIKKAFEKFDKKYELGKTL